MVSDATGIFESNQRDVGNAVQMSVVLQALSGKQCGSMALCSNVEDEQDEDDTDV